MKNDVNLEQLTPEWSWFWEIEEWQMAMVKVYIPKVLRRSTTGKTVLMDATVCFTRWGAVWWNIRSVRRLQRRDRRKWKRLEEMLHSD